MTEYLSGGTLVDFMRNKSKLMGDFITKIMNFFDETPFDRNQFVDEKKIAYAD